MISLIPLKDALALGITERMTTAVSVSAARAGVLNGILADQINAGQRAALVITKGNAEHGEVEVWRHEKKAGVTEPRHTRRYRRLKAAGRCTRCAERLTPDDTMVLCRICANKLHPEKHADQ